jgi:hypothetical protein
VLSKLYVHTVQLRRGSNGHSLLELPHVFLFPE